MTQLAVSSPVPVKLELGNAMRLSGDPELPGFVLDLEPIWKPV